MEAAYLAVAFVIYVVIQGVGGSILAGVQSGQTVGSSAFNATGHGLTGITNLSQQNGTIGTILGAVVMIGLILGAFYMKDRV